MKEKKPVALWKGIAGTAVSSFLLILALILYIPLYFYQKVLPDWTFLWFVVAVVVGLGSLVISIYNLYEAIVYRKIEEPEKKQSPKGKKEEDNSELLHKLLKEGKITIEEYDQLKGK